MRVRHTDTGLEWTFDSDCWSHGVASYRIGQAPSANPFINEGSDQFLSWAAGYETAQRIREKSSEDA